MGAACIALVGCDTMRATGSKVGSAVQSGWDSLFGPSGAVALADVKATQGNAVAGKVQFALCVAAPALP